MVPHCCIPDFKLESAKIVSLTRPKIPSHSGDWVLGEGQFMFPQMAKG